jgi:hypothetical protein
MAVAICQSRQSGCQAVTAYQQRPLP